MVEEAEADVADGAALFEFFLLCGVDGVSAALEQGEGRTAPSAIVRVSQICGTPEMAGSRIPVRR